jgi:hypothetical protein
MFEVLERAKELSKNQVCDNDISCVKAQSQGIGFLFF